MLRAAAIRANGRDTSIDVNPWLWDETYRYDERGNRLSKANGWGRIDYRYDAENRLLQAGTREYDYDTSGNLIMESLGEVSAVYEYDYENRLVDAYSQISGFTGRGKGSTWSLKAGVRYEYDALGRRVSRAEYDLEEHGKKPRRHWDSQSAVAYLYEGLGMEILAELRDEEFPGGDLAPPWAPWLDGMARHRRGWSRPWNRNEGQWSTGRFRAESEYVSAKGEVLERLDFDPSYRTGAVRKDTEYYTQDLLGSTMMLTDREGRLRERYEYDAYGNAYEGSLWRLNAVGYTGKRSDPTTGLIDYGFRDYAPRLGRFTTVDPIRDGLNWYAYCGNDPVNYVDPWGLAEVVCSDNNGRATIWRPNMNRIINSYTGQDITASYQAMENQMKTRQDIENALANAMAKMQEAGKPYIIKQGPMEDALKALGVNAEDNTFCLASALLTAYSVTNGGLLPSDALLALEAGISNGSVGLDGTTASNDFLNEIADILDLEPLSLQMNLDGGFVRATDLEFSHYGGIMGIGEMINHFVLVYRDKTGALTTLNPGNTNTVFVSIRPFTRRED